MIIILQIYIYLLIIFFSDIFAITLHVLVSSGMACFRGSFGDVFIGAATAFNFNFRNLFDNKAWYITHGYIKDINYSVRRPLLNHWGRVTHICVGNLTTIGSDNGLSPGQRQAIIWTNAGILLIGPLWTNFSEILIDIPTFSFKKMHLKVSSAKWRPFCLGLNVLRH